VDFQLTDEQRELRDTARRYARSRLLDVAKECEERGEPPSHDLVHEFASMGFLGINVPERYGGLGADFETYCLVAEQLAQGNASTALTFNMHCLTMMMMGVIADDMAMDPAARERHEELRAVKFHKVVEDGVFMDSPTASRWSRARPIPS